MSKLDQVLKAEISRLARKEVRTALEPVNKRISDVKHTLADINRRLARIERTQKKQIAVARVKGVAPPPPEVEDKSRLSAGLIKKLRKRLNISQADLATLVGVSHAAVSSWEQDRAKPRATTRTAIIALRKMTPTEAADLVEQKRKAGAGA